MSKTPQHQTYDIVIVGGAIMGASAAWFISQDKAFDGRVLVVEKDPSYEFSSTMHTNSCMRQQFSAELNVRISQYAAQFVQNMPDYMDGDWVPKLKVRSFGYMYLADTEDFAGVLRENLAVQKAAGAATQLMTPDQIKAAYPFYNVDDIVLGSINLVDEGLWDGTAVFDAWRKASRANGVEYVHNEVVAMTKNAAGTRVESVTLASSEVIGCGQVLNASGPRASRTAAMAGLPVPVEPRKRYSWIFSAAEPLDRDLPLTIDPSGVHVRENGGGTYQCGAHSEIDPAVAYDDFAMDHSMWENHVWPILATRIPQFEAIKVTHEWGGHYSYNTFDHNAIMGPHDDVENFFFLNGFSGHGLQQSPAMGRGTAEIMVHGSYQTLDLSPFNYSRIAKGEKQIGIWASLASPFAAEVLAPAGYDWALLDMEHAPNDYANVLGQMQAFAASNTTAIVRPEWNDTVIVKKLLDMGARGLLFPMIQSVEEAKKAVAATRYPPRGVRGVSGSTRATGFGRYTDYTAKVEDELTVILQLETAHAIAQAEDIAAVDGVSGIFFGPADIAADIGLLGKPLDPAVWDLIMPAAKMLMAKGVPVGTLVMDPDFAAKLINEGFTFVACGQDTTLLAKATDAALATVKAQIK